MRCSIALLMSIAVVGCGPVRPYKAPEFKSPEIVLPKPSVEFPKDLFVCDVKKDVPEDVKKSGISVRGTSDVQDVESTNCEGKKFLIPKLPLNSFQNDLTIQPPAHLKGPVSYATVENTRTCAERDVSTKNSKKPGSPEWAAEPYSIDKNGLITVRLNDSIVRFQIGLNVSPGQNLIEIVYYGRCLEMNKNGQTCDKGEEIGRQKVLVNAEIERRELNGVKQVDGCVLQKPK